MRRRTENMIRVPKILTFAAAILVSTALLPEKSQAQPCGPWGRPYCGPRSGVSVSVGYGGGYGWGRPWGCAPYYGAYYARPVYVAPPPVVVVEEPVYVEQPVYVQSYVPSTWQISQVQTQLGRLRYYGGKVDGAIGPLTRQAVASFQQDRGLAVTGNINRQVLAALDIEG